MKKLLLGASLISMAALLTFVLAGNVFAGVDLTPDSVNFSGTLSQNGIPANGNFDMQFTILANSTPLWCAQYTSVAVSNGDFSVQLGNSAEGGQGMDTTCATSAPANLPLAAAVVSTVSSTMSVTIRVEVSPDGGATWEQLTPDLSVGSAMFALQADNAQTATSATGLQGVSVSATAPTAGQVLTYSGGVWTPANASSGSPGGASGQIQFNNSGAFGASANLTWDSTNSRLAVGGPVTPASNLDVSGTNANGTFRVFDQSTGSGNTREIIRSGQGQSSNLTEWQNNAGTVLSSMDDTGKLTATGLKIPTGATAGYVLTSDAAGNATWQADGDTSGTVTDVTGTAPISVATGTTTPVVSITQANTTTNGYLSSTDWNTFNGKLSSTLNSADIFVGNGSNVATGVAMSGDASLANTGTMTVTGMQGRSIATTVPAANNFLYWNNATSKWDNASISTILGYTPANGGSYVAKAGDTMTGALTVNVAPAATANYGDLNLGNGGFGGAAGNFAGSANGTVHAINAASGFSGNLADWQVNGSSEFKVDATGVVTASKFVGDGSALTGISGALSGLGTGDVLYATGSTTAATSTDYAWDNTNHKLTLNTTNAPTGDALEVKNSPAASATSSLAAFGPSDIASGNANGTYIGANAASGYTGDLVNLEVNGASKFKVDASGNVTATAYYGDGSNLTGISGALSGLTSGDVLYATSGTTAATTTDYAWDNTNHKLTLNTTNAPTGDAFEVKNSPAASATSSLAAFGPSDIASGNANGTYIGANASSGYSGDLMNLEVNGTSEFKVSSGGTVTATKFIGDGSGLTGVATSAAGATSQIQFNNANAFDATSDFTWDNTNHGLTVDTTDAPTGDALEVKNSPAASATSSLAAFGPSNIASGNANGTYIGTNAASGYTGDLMNLEVNGTSEFKVDATGKVTASKFVGDGSLLTGISGALSGLTSGEVLYASGANSAATSSDYAWDNTNHKLTLNTTTAPTGDALEVKNSPAASATSSLAAFGPSDIASGNANGTFIGVNAASGYTGDLANLEVNGTSKFKVDASGNVTATAYYGDGSNLTGISGALTGLTTGDVLYATGSTTAGTTTDYAWDNTNHKLTLNTTNAPTGDALQIANAPKASATNALLSLGASDIASGNANGTFYGANAASGYTGDLANLEVNGTSEFKVDATGKVTATKFSGDGSLLTGISGTMSGLTSGDVLYATGSTTAGTTADYAWDNTNHKLTLNTTNAPTGDALQIKNAPKASAANALLSLGASDIASGNANGTFIGANAASGYTGDLANLEVNGTSEFKIDATGNVTATKFTGDGSGLTGVTPSFSGLTTGGVMVSTSATAIGQDASNFFWDSTNHRLGIGTTSPADPLDVIGDGSTNDAMVLENTNSLHSSTIDFKDNTGTQQGWMGWFNSGASGSNVPNSMAIGTASTNPIVFDTNFGERMRIDGSGNVGIGTASPVDLLSLGSVTASATHAELNLSNTALSGASASGTYIGANPASAGADFMNYQVGGTSKFKVDSAGNVTATSFTGDGSGLTGISGALSGLTSGDLMFASGTSTASTSGDAAWDNTNHKMTLNTTNAPTGDALEVKNSPAGSATASLLALGPSDLSGGNASGTYIGANAASGYGGDLMNLEVNGSSKFKVDSAGNVTATKFTGDGSGLTGVSATPAGANTQVQFNNSGVMGASSGLTWDNTNDALTITGTGGASDALSVNNSTNNGIVGTTSGTGNYGVEGSASGTGGMGIFGVGFGTSGGVEGQSAASWSGYFQSGQTSNTTATLITQQYSTGTADLFQAQNASGTSLAKITSSGDVGIGATSPAASLDIKTGGDSSTGDLLHLENTNNADNDAATFYDDAGTEQMELGYGNSGSSFNAGTAYLWLASENFQIQTSSAALLDVTNGGDVGVGTSSPSVAMDVRGQVRSIASGHGSSTVYNNTATTPSTTTIDWNNGNVQTSAVICDGTNAISMTHMYEGGSYTLIVTGSATGECLFDTSAGTPNSVGTSGSGNWRFQPANATPSASTTTVYTFLVAGGKAYVSWITGF